MLHRINPFLQVVIQFPHSCCSTLMYAHMHRQKHTHTQTHTDKCSKKISILKKEGRGKGCKPLHKNRLKILE